VKNLVFLGSLLLLGLAYLLNLGSFYAPTNGDEMVYLHIARMTSESGHLLPLQSELQNMRNTKPPLLFWQAMAAGSWGWDLWTLRLPYVLETLLTSGIVGWLTGYLIRVRSSFNLLAAALYLGFFATYRYGRPVLSSSIESLFLFGGCALVIAKQESWKAYPVRLAVVLGLLMIPALLSKSFALAVPVGLWLFLSLWIIQKDQDSFPFGLSLSKASIQRFWQSAWPSALAVAIGVAGFALWFAFDPDPSAVWREFIVGENFSTKFSGVRSDSITLFWLSPLTNAGMLFPLVIGLGLAALQAMRDKDSRLPIEEKLLWLWVFSWMLVFTLPSQRSSRYIIPAMPAVAVLLAMYADRIHRAWWLLTLALVASATLVLGWAAHSLNTVFPVGLGYSLFYFVAIGALLLACAIGFLSARFRVLLTAAGAVAWLALLGALAAPFDRGLGRFDARVTQVVAGQKLMVPQNFNAQFERFQFALHTVPRVQPLPYMASEAVSPASLLQQAPYAIITRPLRIAKPVEEVGYNIIATRLVLRGRQDPGEVTWDSITDAKALAHLLVEREVLIGTKN
jgi:hypothetical protein